MLIPKMDLKLLLNSSIHEIDDFLLDKNYF